MALEDLHSNLVFFLRWLHIFAAIIWLGHLYFFNFVNAPFQTKLDKEIKPRVNPPLLLRALWWFRWSAMITVLAGLSLFFVKYGMGGAGNGILADSDGNLTGRAIWILCGMGLGILMWFNVWFIIWPAQKLLLMWVREGANPPEQIATARRAAQVSKLNTYLSGPLLFCMIAPNNYGAFSVGSLAIVSLVGVGVIFGLFQISKVVGPAS